LGRCHINDKDESLKRLGGGRWQTRDERFTIEPQSGTWVVVDAEQLDDLGLPLIRGPFRSLGDAKESIVTARTTRAPVRPIPKPRSQATGPRPASTAEAAPKARRPSKLEPPAEPRWLTDLPPDDRRRARQAIKRLTEAGASDPEGLTRRDIMGDVAAIAAFAVNRRLRALGDDASPESIAAALADGRDEDLGVRWRLVEGEGRTISLDRDGSKG
jgi:hypothetical protein